MKTLGRNPIVHIYVYTILYSSQLGDAGECKQNLCLAKGAHK